MYLFPGKDNSCLDNPFETMSSKRLNKIISLTCSHQLICCSVGDLRKSHYGWPYVPVTEDGNCRNMKMLLRFLHATSNLIGQSTYLSYYYVFMASG